MGFIFSILIGTAILWGLIALVVIPIVSFLTSRHQVVAVEGSDEMENTQTEQNTNIFTFYYVLVSVLVLGLSGFIMGLTLGWFFLGFAWDGKTWPGMIAFIIASIMGSLIYSG